MKRNKAIEPSTHDSTNTLDEYATEKGKIQGVEDKVVIPLLVALAISGYWVGFLMTLDWSWNCYSRAGVEETCRNQVLQFISKYGEKFHGILNGSHFFVISAIALSAFLVLLFALILVARGGVFRSVLYTIRAFFGLIAILELGIYLFDNYFWELQVTLYQVGTSLEWFSNADLFELSMGCIVSSFLCEYILSSYRRLTKKRLQEATRESGFDDPHRKSCGI